MLTAKIGCSRTPHVTVVVASGLVASGLDVGSVTTAMQLRGRQPIREVCCQKADAANVTASGRKQRHSSKGTARRLRPKGWTDHETIRSKSSPTQVTSWTGETELLLEQSFPSRRWPRLTTILSDLCFTRPGHADRVAGHPRWRSKQGPWSCGAAGGIPTNPYQARWLCTPPPHIVTSPVESLPPREPSDTDINRIELPSYFNGLLPPKTENSPKSCTKNNEPLPTRERMCSLGGRPAKTLATALLGSWRGSRQEDETGPWRRLSSRWWRQCRPLKRW